MKQTTTEPRTPSVRPASFLARVAPSALVVRAGIKAGRGGEVLEK
ncbi:MAG: hypothetical protein U0324_35150 [Polyangiales bacterium]